MAVTDQPPRHPAVEVFLAFLKLGLTSFGGPIAHLGYFRAEFVEHRRWLDDKRYTDLVALCQFLPGPTSSQVGMALGLGRAGWLGLLGAWCGFTLPSAVLLIVFAFGVSRWAGVASSGAVHGLKVVAVAVVAQAVWGMSKTLCPDRSRRALAVVACVLVLSVSTALGQIAAIVLGAIVGLLLVRADELPLTEPFGTGVNTKVAGTVLVVFAALLFVLPIAASTTSSMPLAAVSVFYRAGALVFGGGHVVLPLLQAGVVPPGWVSNDAFLAGYGAAQAVPGPLFTFAAYLGATMPGPLGGWGGGLLLLVAIFLPALLLVVGVLPFWEALRRRRSVQQALAGINAAVVGVLAAALYDPVWTSAIRSKADFGVAIAAFGLLVFGRVSPVMVVIAAAAAGWVLAI